MKPESKLTFSIIEEIDKIENIRPFWESHQWYPYSEINYYINVISKHQNFVNPYIIVIYRNAKPVSIVVSRIIKNEYKVKMGYKVLFGIPLTSLEVIYGGILGETSKEVQSLIIKQIKKGFKEKKYDSAKIKYLDINNEKYNLLIKSDCIFSRKFTKIVNPHWRLRVPNTYDEYLNGRSNSTKKNIRSCKKKVENKINGEVEIIEFTKYSDLNKIMNDTHEIASQTYQRALGVSIINTQHTRNEYSFLLKNRMLSCWILYINKKPAAYNIGVVYKNYFLGSKMGYSPLFRTENVGTYLLVHMFKTFCESNKVSIVDFGFGEADYKKSFGNEVFKESTITLYTPTLKGIYLQMVITFSRLLLTLPKRVMKNATISKVIKKKWRQKLSQPKYIAIK